MEIKNVKEKINSPRMRLFVKIVLVAAIFLYPFIHTFIGIDLGDSGYHLFAFEHIYESPEVLGFTSYFTSVVGWAWLKLFPSLGVWGLNLLEVIVEMLMVFAVYKTFKNYFGEIRTLIGLFLAIVASDTYLNIFNYHQFNVLLLVLILCFEFVAITKDKVKYSVFAGICLTTVAFARMGSVTALASLVLYLYWYFIKDIDFKFVLRHYIAFFVGALVAVALLAGLLVGTGQMSYFMANILRLSGLASTGGGGYSMDNLLSTFVKGNLYSIAHGALYFAGFFVLVLGLGIVFKKYENVKKSIVNVVAGLSAAFVGVYMFKYAFYVNDVPNWPQMTPAPSFVIGVFYVVAFLTLSFHLYAAQGQREISLIGLMSIGLPLLTIAGSNTGTKHVILGLWIIAPMVVYAIGQLLMHEKVFSWFDCLYSLMGVHLTKVAWRLSILILCASFLYRYEEMARQIMNFDSTDRSLITSQIDSPKLKYLWTTERQADAVNGVLHKIEETSDDDRALIVYGGSMMMYSLTDMDSYVQPWFTNGVYANETVIADLEKAEETQEKLPVIIYGRTNNYRGFYEYDYAQRIREIQSTNYGGKREILLEFAEKHGYALEYVNDYYVVLYPPDIAESTLKPYIGFITGSWEEINAGE